MMSIIASAVPTDDAVDLRDLKKELSRLGGEIPRQNRKQPWWVIIDTKIPECTYYFGPFTALEEACASQYGYVEDLLEEQAQGLRVVIKRCQPTTLTVATGSIF